VARGSTGAPRNTPDPDVPAAGGDIRTAQTQDTQERGSRHRQTRPGSPQTSPDQGKPGKPRGVSRLVAFICGRRTKWVVVVFWLVVVAALGSLAGKLQGAEKNDAASYLPASAESTQELNEQAIFQSKNYNPALVVYVRDSGVTAADIAKADADARSFARLLHPGPQRLAARGRQLIDALVGPSGLLDVLAADQAVLLEALQRDVDLPDVR